MSPTHVQENHGHNEVFKKKIRVESSTEDKGENEDQNKIVQEGSVEPRAKRRRYLSENHFKHTVGYKAEWKMESLLSKTLRIDFLIQEFLPS